jgi:hypothetical protein
MSVSTRWTGGLAAAVLSGIALLTPIAAQAEHTRIVSGLAGAQDDTSKALLALPPAAASDTATRDLLSVLKPTGTFLRDNSNDVDGMTFVTPAYQTIYAYVCRQDRVTLRYTLDSRYDAAGKWLAYERKPVGVDAQQTFHIEQLPVPGFVPGTSFTLPICDASHPGAAAAWFQAPSARDAVRAANLFRMAEDKAKARDLTPDYCDKHGTQTCRDRLLSLDDPAKIERVEPCAGAHANACYVISFDDADVTVEGTIPKDEMEPVTPTAITSVRVDDVITISV